MTFTMVVTPFLTLVYALFAWRRHRHLALTIYLPGNSYLFRHDSTTEPLAKG